MTGNIVAAGRLRELPDLGETNAAFGGAWRTLGKRTSGRGRAGIVDRPVNDLALSSILANVFRSHDVAVVFAGDTGAVNARTESGGGGRIHPCIDGRFLLGQHASA